jgi:hypothetical protein
MAIGESPSRIVRAVDESTEGQSSVTVVIALMARNADAFMDGLGLPKVDLPGLGRHPG